MRNIGRKIHRRVRGRRFSAKSCHLNAGNQETQVRFDIRAETRKSTSVCSGIRHKYFGIDLCESVAIDWHYHSLQGWRETTCNER